ncbi:MAG: N-acetyltransferase family protein [Steroidobacteraceae bacterium]
MQVRNAEARDADALARIYNPYITSTVITFEEDPVDAPEMARRVGGVQDAGLVWLVMEDDAGVAGYAYATTWRTRAAYRHSVETAVYLPPDRFRSGVGSTLYLALAERLATRGIRAMLGCIALPNEPSVALHEKLGFEKVGHFPGVGRKFDRWIDVGFWQLNLSR